MSLMENVNNHNSSSSDNIMINVNDNVVHPLHVMFLPYLAPGHMIQLVEIAKLMATLPGIKASVVTTAGNASAVKPSIEGITNMHLVTLPFSGTADQENLRSLPTPLPTPEFMAAIDALQPDFELIVGEHRPDCIIADVFYPWANDVASKFGIPRIALIVSGSFPGMVLALIRHFKAYEGVTDDYEPFLVPNIPHRITFTKSQLSFFFGYKGAVVSRENLQKSKFISCPPTTGFDPETFSLASMRATTRVNPQVQSQLSDYSYTESYWSEFVDRMGASVQTCFGNVVNSFYELEPEYVDMMKAGLPNKMWNIGPVSLCNQHHQQRCAYNDDNNATSQQQLQHPSLNWLDKQPQESVVYVCFGSLGQFTSAQLREMAAGLESCGHPFLWVIRGDSNGIYDEAAPAAMTSDKAMIVRGWVPQKEVLAHPALGGFVTHCGWNSFLEGLSAGLPLITWPLFAEQFGDEKLSVDVLKTGVAVGSKKWSNVKEERTLVRAAELKAAVQEVMGKGEEAEERRRRARKVADMARAAVAEGGSSRRDLMRMIQDLKDAKLARIMKPEY